MPGWFCYRAAVLRGGPAVAVPPLRLPSYSLRSYPSLFLFFKEKRKESSTEEKSDRPLEVSGLVQTSFRWARLVQTSF